MGLARECGIRDNSHAAHSRPPYARYFVRFVKAVVDNAFAALPCVAGRRTEVKAFHLACYIG